MNPLQRWLWQCLTSYRHTVVASAIVTAAELLLFAWTTPWPLTWTTLWHAALGLVLTLLVVSVFWWMLFRCLLPNVKPVGRKDAHS